MEQKWSKRSRRVCDNDPKKEPRVMKKRQRATKQKKLGEKMAVVRPLKKLQVMSNQIHIFFCKETKRKTHKQKSIFTVSFGAIEALENNLEINSQFLAYLITSFKAICCCMLCWCCKIPRSRHDGTVTIHLQKSSNRVFEIVTKQATK